MRAVHVAISLVVGLLLRYLYRRFRRDRLRRGAVALITGGGSGLGLEFALLFAKAGCSVVLVGRNEESLANAVRKCSEAGAMSANFIVADLSTVDGVAKVAREFDALHHGDLKYLILNAGAGAIVPFSTAPRFEQVCVDMMNINYLCNVRLLQAFLSLLTAQHSVESPSRIIVISSLAGVLPSVLRSGYTASKHAIQGFMNALRGETPVAITLCCPGYVDTDFHQRVLTSDGKPLPGHQRRGVPPAECARICLNGALNGDAEVIMTLTGKLGYCLRPYLTAFVDMMAKRKSLKSISS